jgi:TM2 domain-containing membrane protein YozV
MHDKRVLLWILSEQFMKKSIKAALLSGLLFPGIGHFYLKRYIHGIVLFSGAAYAIYFIVSVVVTAALQVSEKIQIGGVPLDVAAISDLVSQKVSGAEQSTNVAMIALVALWVISIADSYRQGRALDKVEEKAAEKET